MRKGLILLAIGIALIVAVLYSTFCYVPGRESRKEEREGKQNDSK